VVQFGNDQAADILPPLMSSSSSSEQPRLLPKVLSFLSSVSGSDKVFRTLVYTLRIASVTLNNKYGEGKSPLAKRISNFTCAF